MRRYRRDYVWGGSAPFSATPSGSVPARHRHRHRRLEPWASPGKRSSLYAGLLSPSPLAKASSSFCTRWILIGISRDIEFDLRNDLFRQLEQQAAEYYQQHRTGDIMARMTNDLNAVRMLLGPAIMYSANTVLFSVFALFFLLRISPCLTLVALAPLPLASILVQFWAAGFTSASSASRPCFPTSPRRRRRTSPARA